MRSFQCAPLLLLSFLGAPSSAEAQPSAPPSPAPELLLPEPAALPVRGGAAIQLLGARNLLRSSFFNWTTLASTKALGIGKDYVGAEDDPVRMSFALAPRFSLLDTGKHWLRVGTKLAFGVDLTKSESTTTTRDVRFADLPIELAYDYTFLQQKSGLTFLAGPELGVSFPTSSASQSQGIDARTQVGIGAKANVPLLRAAWLNGLFLRGGMEWSHTFSRGNTSFVSSKGVPSRPRVDPLTSSDLSGATFLTHDAVSLRFAAWLNLWGDLSLGNSWGYQLPFRYSPSSSDCVVVASGCVPTVAASSPITNIPTTAFDLSLGYAFARLVWAEIGYSNVSRTLSESGTRRSVFYSPDAQFYLSGTVFLDGAFGRIEEAIRPKPVAPAPRTARSSSN
jgi:hypothetical protein